jgi:hypothetical protein
MITLTFGMSYRLGVPSHLFDISEFRTVNTSSYMATDLVKRSYFFSLSFLATRVKLLTDTYSLGFRIDNTVRTFSFILPYIYNKEELNRTRTFRSRFNIQSVNSSVRNFTLRSRIVRSVPLRTNNFALKYLNSSAGLKTFYFTLLNKIEKSNLQHKIFNLPYYLSAGDNLLPEITVNSSNAGISNVSYKIDGLSANIGDIDHILNTTIDPILMYVVVNNGSFSMMRTARFEITEATKNTVQVDKGITMSLLIDKIKIDFNADISVPISVKIYRGVI